MLTMPRPPILELGDLVPERIPLRINRVVSESPDGPDGSIRYNTEMVTLQAYMFGSGCPVLVKAALHRISRKYMETMREEGYSDAAFCEYARDSFMQLIPGLSFEEADMLAADDNEKEGRCVKTLKYLNYWMVKEPNSEEAPNPEVKAEESLTTVESSQI